MPKIVDKPKRREEIARKAMPLFAESGFENTPIREITRHAGIGKGTFYDYFKDKEDIMNEVVRLMFSDWMDVMVAKVGNTKDPLKRLQVILKEGSSLSEQFEQLMIIYMDIWRWSVSKKGTGSFVDQFKSFLEENRQVVIKLIESAQKQGQIKLNIDKEALATTIIALIDGFCLHQMILKPDFDAKLMSEKFFELLLTGIKNVL